ncbi:MAG: DUF167 domain-containing protein [Candidatus Woesearchaeota archaeon]
MEIKKYIENGTLSVHVVPHSSRQELIEEEGKLKLYLQAVPDKNKANLELIKFFKKEWGLKVEIKSGMKSRDKILRVLNNETIS